MHMLVDTGATDNIINSAILKRLGIGKSDIQNKKKYVLSSAIGKSTDMILGDVDLTVFLRNVKGKFYPVKQKFCVIKGPLLTPILSMRMLRELRFAWRQKLDPISKEPVDEILSLNVQDPTRGKTVRRAFRTHQRPKENVRFPLRNDTAVSLQAGQTGMVDLVMETPPCGIHLGSIRFHNDLMDISEPRVRVNRQWNTSERECREGFRRSTLMTVSCKITAKRNLEVAPGKIRADLMPTPGPARSTRGSTEAVLGFSDNQGQGSDKGEHPVSEDDKERKRQLLKQT